MKRKGFVLGLVLILTMTMSTVFAQGGITVRMNSTDVEFKEGFGTPFIDENDRTLVPFRAVLEEYGADVDWDGTTRTAMATTKGITIEIPIGENYIVRNGKKIESDTAAIIKENRTYLPIRKVMEEFGADVQWDKSLKTVVITTEPFDAKEKVMEAYDKSYQWKNYDMNMLMNMSITMPDGEGNFEDMDIKIDMNATAFMDPIKLMLSGNMIMDLAGFEMSEPIVEMYMLAEDDKFTSYTNMTNPMTGDPLWVKEEVEGAGLVGLIGNNEEAKELNEQSIKEVKYLGTYNEEDRKLEKYEITISFEGMEELMEEALGMLSGTITDDELGMGLDLLDNISDMTYTLYIEESTGEFAKMEMDLTSMINSMLEEIINIGIGETEIPEGLTEEELKELEELEDELREMMEGMSIEMDFVAEYLNINTAEDFEIPKETLDAITMEEYLELLEEWLEDLELED